MINWVPTAITAVITFAAGYFTHVLVVRREAAGRRRVFRGLLRSYVQKIEAFDLQQLRNGDVFPVQQASVADIGEECAKILDDIPTHSQAKFDAARREYCGLKRKDVEPADVVPPWCDPPTPVHNYEHGRQRVVELLKRMIEYAP
jgi:hypothetical protein